MATGLNLPACGIGIGKPAFFAVSPHADESAVILINTPANGRVAPMRRRVGDIAQDSPHDAGKRGHCGRSKAVRLKIAG